MSVEEWLEEMYAAGKELNDPLPCLDALERMERLRSRPTLGWIRRNMHLSGSTASPH
jgi:hypothetical protein